MRRFQRPSFPRRRCRRANGRRYQLRCERLEPRSLFSVSPAAPPAVDLDCGELREVDRHDADERHHEPHRADGASAEIDCEGFPIWTPSPIADLPPLPLFPLDQTFTLRSRPSARHRVYLDFDGHTTSETFWNENFTNGADFTTPPYTIDTSAAFSDRELANIQDIWARVAEDLAPFDVDVTTQEPPLSRLRRLGEGDTMWGIRMVVGGTCTQWYKPDIAGVAYRGSFTWDSDTPGFVFSDDCNQGHPAVTARVAIHEIGHTLGLRHDGRAAAGEEYYGGHGSGPTSWAPIMGNGVDPRVVQWSRGEYADASNTEDDLAIITSRNGFGFRPDDYGNTLAAASFVPTPAGRATVKGVITTSGDVDVFRFFTWDRVKVTITPGSRSPNLDVLARLWNASGVPIQTIDPAEALDAFVDLAVPPGFYSLAIRGTGKGTATEGYTAYGSLGSYAISLETNPQPPVVSIESVDAVHAEGHAGSRSYAFTVTRSGSTTGTTRATWQVVPAGSAATAADFVGGKLPSGKVTFLPGQTSAAVDVFVRGDHVLELHEGFTVKLTKVIAGSVGKATAGGLIFNDDSYRTALVIAATAARKAEGDSASTPFVFTVTRSGATSGAHTIKWAVTGAGAAATDSDDFVGAALPRGTLTFAAGQTVKQITVLVRGDFVPEPDEGFLVRLSDLVGDAAGIVTGVAGGVISDDDPSPAS